MIVCVPGIAGAAWGGGQQQEEKQQQHEQDQEGDQVPALGPKACHSYNFDIFRNFSYRCPYLLPGTLYLQKKKVDQ
jgi:hypothetical protein